MSDPIALLSVATAVPPHRLDQRDAAAAAHAGFAARYDDFERLARVFLSSGIRSRYLIRPVEWYMEDHGWQDRNAAYLSGAEALFVDAATRALDKAPTPNTPMASGTSSRTMAYRSLTRRSAS